jgi:hypothetical protein
MELGFKVLHLVEWLLSNGGISDVIRPGVPPVTAFHDSNLSMLALTIKQWGRELGFAEIRISGIDLSAQEAGLRAWLDAGHHGEMDYMAAHGMKRARPAELVPGTVRVITARMDYLPAGTPDDWRAREERPRFPSTRAAATITRCCVRACSSWPTASAQKPVSSATGCLPIRRP